MTTIGILGGGQLARMMALAGAPLGLRFLVMDSAADACAAQFVPLLGADYRDETALAEFARRVDVVTFDFENVPAESAQWLAERVPVFPSPRALAVAQDRLAEKSLFRELGIGVPAFAAVDTRAQLDQAAQRGGHSGDPENTPARLRRQGPVSHQDGGRSRCRLGRVGRAGGAGRTDPRSLRAVRSAKYRWSRCVAATASSAPGR